MRFVVCLLGLTACAPFGAQVDSERPINAGDSYLEQAGGPQSRVSRGESDEGETLLARFQKLLEEKVTIEQELRLLREEATGLRTSLDSARQRHDAERERLAATEADAERLRRENTLHETRILELQLQVVRLEREKLELQIAAADRELAPVPAAEPPEGR